MKTKWVITVGREFCSGGSETGRILSELLEVPYYDKAIIDETAELTQFARDVVERHDEQPVGYMDVSNFQFQYSGLWYANDPTLQLPTGMQVAEAQFKVIRKAAAKGPCVVVGRCADYALEKQKNVLRVFIRSSVENRVRRAMEQFGISEADARKQIRRTDRIRSGYYNYYTERTWGDPANYDLVIDAGRLGTDGAAAVIAAYAQQFDP